MEKTVFSLNARGLKDWGKRSALFFSLKSMAGDCIFLQECHLGGGKDVATFMKDWKWGPSVWSVGNVHADGLGILFKGGGVFIEEFISVVPGRLLCVDVLWGGGKFRLLNVHAPCNISERLGFFKMIPEFLATNRTIILGGDFNVSLEEGVVGSRRDFSVNFLKKEILVKFSLVDCFRACGRGREGFTWENSRGCRRRLDYFFVSVFKPNIFEVVPSWASDHSLIKCVLEGEQGKRGGFWKFNVEFLDDATFVEQFTEFYLGWRAFKPLFSCILEWWEVVKKRIKEFCSAYGAAKRREERERVRVLQRELQYWVGVANRGGRVNREEVKSIKEEMRRYYAQKARRFAFLAGVEKREKDEKVTPFFFRAVRARQSSNFIDSLVTDQGEAKEQEDKLDAASLYYSGLFGREERDCEEGDKMVAELWREVQGTQREALGGKISMAEVKEALFSMKAGKTPGKDGLTRELYVGFWGVMADDLVQVFNRIGEVGEMPRSMREGVVHLLFKKGDRRELGNWRPITLLCTDYKILGKVLANRAKKVLGEVVGQDQTCAVPGRMGAQNLALLRDVLCWARSRRVGVGVVGLDQQKAFDRVDHAFLWQVLGKMGFGEGFILWVKILYRGVFSRIKINGALSAPVAQGRGVRQGCPLSPLLYVCFIEPLAELLRKDRVLKGVQIPGSGGECLKVMQYADDTTVVVSSERDMERAMVLVGRYCRGSGSKVNWNKSVVMVTEGWRGKSGEQHGLAVCKDGIKILGVRFTRERAETVNWKRCVEKVSRRIEMWRARALTLSGKVLVVKVDLLPQVIYLARVFPIPAFFKLRLGRLIFRFLWGGRLEPVKREILFLPVEEGGRGLVDVGLKLEVLFIKGLYDTLVGDGDHKCRFLMKMWVGTTMREWVGWDNTGPRADDIPWHYEKAILFLRANKGELTAERLGNHRALYRAILERRTREVEKGVRRNNVQWRYLAAKGIPNRESDLSWLGGLGRLPVRERLYRAGTARSPWCPRGCGREETGGHALWECGMVRAFWGRANRLLFLPVWGVAVDREMVMRAVGVERVKPEGREVFSLLLSWGKTSIWDSRNEVVLNPTKGLSGVQCSMGWVRRVEREIKMYAQVMGQNKCEKKWGKIREALRL